MAEFFIHTDATASGPFTGIELREAALAGILTPESAIAGSPAGPWILAPNAGLFSEKKIALPHPPEVTVPRFQVRGMPGAFKGPFKLRELIGLAARGMLPSDALLQSDRTEAWIPVERIKILSACLRGELTLVDPQGNVIRRAIHPSAPPINTAMGRAPIEVSKSADPRDATAFGASWEETPDECPSRLPASQNADETLSDPSERLVDSRLARFRERFRDLHPRVFESRSIIDGLFTRKALTSILCLLGVLAVGSSIHSWRNQPMHPSELLGQWIGDWPVRDEESPSPFGIAFRTDGRCVVFSPTAESWTGDYHWVERSDQPQGLEKIESFTVTVDTAEPQHAVDVVRPTDGYLRFLGGREDLPTIGGHRMSDAFVRRENQKLLIGYLTEVEYSGGEKQMKAAWIPTDLADRPTAVGRIPTTGDLSAMKPAELLNAFGVPDEVRPAYPFELSSTLKDDLASNFQVLRFSNKKWLLGLDDPVEHTVEGMPP